MIETIYTICTAMDVRAWRAYALLFMHRFVHVYACMELNILYVCRAVAIKWHACACTYMQDLAAPGPIVGKRMDEQCFVSGCQQYTSTYGMSRLNMRPLQIQIKVHTAVSVIFLSCICIYISIFIICMLGQVVTNILHVCTNAYLFPSKLPRERNSLFITPHIAILGYIQYELDKYNTTIT